MLITVSSQMNILRTHDVEPPSATMYALFVVFQRAKQKHVVRRLEKHLACCSLARSNANDRRRTPFVQRLGFNIYFAARHRLEKVHRRAVAYIVHTERIRSEPAANFTNEISRSAMNAAAIVA